jgi:hypothetical protein
MHLAHLLRSNRGIRNSDYCWSANMHNLTISICSDSKATLFAPSSYTVLVITLRSLSLGAKSLRH